MPVVLSIKKFLQPKLRLCVFDVHHRYIVFTIPSEYRFLFRKDRKALNLLFVAARNTISLLFNKKLYSKIIKDKKDYKKATNIAEKIIDIAQQYKADMTFAHRLKFVRLVQAFKKYN